MAWKEWVPAPLPSSFMLTAIMGFIISAMWVLQVSFNWGVTFLLFFTIMFFAAVASMTSLSSKEEREMEMLAKGKKKR